MSIPKIIPERNSREKFLSEVEITKRYPRLYNIGGEFSVFISRPDNKRDVYIPILINLERTSLNSLPAIILTIDSIKFTKRALREFDSLSVTNLYRIAAEIVSQLDRLRLVKRSFSMDNDISHIIQEEKTVEVKDLESFTLYSYDDIRFSSIALDFNTRNSLEIKDFMMCSEGAARSNIEMYIKGNIL